MDQQKRLLLAIALSFGLTLVFTNFVWKPPLDASLDGGVVALEDGGLAVPPTLAANPLVDADGGALAAAPNAPALPQPSDLPARSIEAQRPSTKMVFTTEGAGLVDAVLLGKREHMPQQLTIPEGFKKLFGGTFSPPPQMDLAEPVPGDAPQFAISIEGATPLASTQRYAVKEEGPGRLVFTTVTGPWEVTKTFTWPVAAATDGDPSGYVSNLEVAIRNTSANPVGGEFSVHATRAIDPAVEQAPSMFGGIGNQASVLCRVADDVKRKVPPAEGGFGCGGTPVFDLEEKGLIHYIGIDQQYFLTAVWPKDAASEGRCFLSAKHTARNATLSVPLMLQPGQTLTKSYGMFLGPKDLELLQAVGKTGAVAGTYDPGLDKTVDFGWWAFIAKALVTFLRFFHNLIGNWGLAIIALTIAVKLVLLPLTHRAMVSAESMKKLQPKMEDIRKKYPDDREKQNVEMMKLYQEAKVNPLGGCLPLLLQLPIWGALFTTLRTSYELYGQPFAMWGDLTSKDPTYLLPFALGITMIVTQRLQPQMTMDKSQAFMMTWIMPVFFTGVMMNYPSGLALYIFTNNLLSIVQQYALRKWLQRTGQAAPKVEKEKEKGAAR